MNITSKHLNKIGFEVVKPVHIMGWQVGDTLFHMLKVDGSIWFVNARTQRIHDQKTMSNYVNKEIGVVMTINMYTKRSISPDMDTMLIILVAFNILKGNTESIDEYIQKTSNTMRLKFNDGDMHVRHFYEILCKKLDNIDVTTSNL